MCKISNVKFILQKRAHTYRIKLINEIILTTICYMSHLLSNLPASNMHEAFNVLKSEGINEILSFYVAILFLKFYICFTVFFVAIRYLFLTRNSKKHKTTHGAVMPKHVIRDTIFTYSIRKIVLQT